jgi:hypothetical protein
MAVTGVGEGDEGAGEGGGGRGAGSAGEGGGKSGKGRFGLRGKGVGSGKKGKLSKLGERLRSYSPGQGSPKQDCGSPAHAPTEPLTTPRRLSKIGRRGPAKAATAEADEETRECGRFGT